MQVFNKYWWRHRYYAVRDFLISQNQWARKSIPRHFADVDGVFEEVLFNGLISYWEDDNGEETLRYQFEYEDVHYEESPFTNEEIREKSREIYAHMLAAYEWAKIRKQEYESLGYDYNQESELIAIDTRHLLNIITHRKYLWS